MHAESGVCCKMRPSSGMASHIDPVHPDRAVVIDRPKMNQHRPAGIPFPYFESAGIPQDIVLLRDADAAAARLIAVNSFFILFLLLSAV